MKNLTPKQAARMLETKTIMFVDGDIQSYKSKGRTVWIDNRTVHHPHPESAVVYPLALDTYHVYIVCPYCGEIHVHGNARGDYEGNRVPHCGTGTHPNYEIKAISGKD